MSGAAKPEALSQGGEELGLNIRYILLRVVRHTMPSSLVRILLRRGLVIHPGLETSDPAGAVERYQAALESAGIKLAGKRLLIFGYGGSFAVGCGLLRRGAEEVLLNDKYAPPDPARNLPLLAEYGEYLALKEGQVLPASQNLRVVEGDIRQVARQAELPPVDSVLSSSVYEHLEDVAGITHALASLTSPGGTHLHYIDLRDHYFKYPFEMLTYSEHAWRSWLNPTSNLNRFRLPDYRRAFEQFFNNVEIKVLASDRAGFERIERRIRPEFKSGDPQTDAATHIQVLARSPKTTA